MDLAVIRKKLSVWSQKYRYVAIILIVGIVLMLLPGQTKKAEDSPQAEPVQHKPQLEITAAALEAILSQIKGAGRVEVLLTCAAGERTVFQTDGRSSSSESGGTEEYETVLISNDSRTEEALVSQILAPEYLGAVVVCQGADDPSVSLAVTEAVSKATGLGTNRISVLKMK